MLPNATIAEVMSRVPVEPLPDAPHWLLGQIAWYGWKVPLVSFARLTGLGAETVATNNKIVVLKALGGNPDLPYVALLTQSFPQLISVPRDGLLADASEENPPARRAYARAARRAERVAAGSGGDRGDGGGAVCGGRVGAISLAAVLLLTASCNFHRRCSACLSRARFSVLPG